MSFDSCPTCDAPAKCFIEEGRKVWRARTPANIFAEQYAERSGVTVEWLKEHGRDVRPCYCGDEMCEGWQMVNVADWEEDQRMRGLM